MNHSVLFKKPEIKSEFMTIRLTPAQKRAVIELAEQMNTNISQLFLCSIGEKFERMDCFNDNTPTTEGLE